MTDLDFLKQKLSELEALDKAATKGPIEIIRYDNDGGDINYQIETKIGENHHIYANVWNKKSDAKFIAESRNAFPGLLKGIGVLLKHTNMCYCDEEQCTNCYAIERCAVELGWVDGNS